LSAIENHPDPGKPGAQSIRLAKFDAGCALHGYSDA